MKNRAKPAVTPWRRVYSKFRMSQSDFAKCLNRHRSKISRELKDKKGLISGRDQELILAAAKRAGVALSADDMMPTQQ